MGRSRRGGRLESWDSRRWLEVLVVEGKRDMSKSL
jgi:hypothetical protein